MGGGAPLAEWSPLSLSPRKPGNCSTCLLSSAGATGRGAGSAVLTPPEGGSWLFTRMLSLAVRALDQPLVPTAVPSVTM